MLLSIVIPTLNEEKYLPGLLESIKGQNFKDYEIIVADAGSEDRTVEIARSFGCRVVKGGRLPRGRNKGAEVAKGDFILFLDADSRLEKDSLNELLKEFKRRKLVVAGCLFEPFGQKKKWRILYTIFFNLPLLLSQRFLPHLAAFILVKKGIHQKIGGFNEDIKILEDCEYARRAAKLGKFGILRSRKFFYSQRRFKEEGFFKNYLKYILADLHLIFLGPVKSDIFKYRYGNWGNN